MLTAILCMLSTVIAQQKIISHQHIQKRITAKIDKSKSSGSTAVDIRSLVQQQIHSAQIEQNMRTSSKSASKASYSKSSPWNYFLALLISYSIFAGIVFFHRKKHNVVEQQQLEVQMIDAEDATVSADEPLPLTEEEPVPEDEPIANLARQYHTGQGEVMLALNLLSRKHGKTGLKDATFNRMIDQNEPPEKIARTLHRVRDEVEFAVQIRKYQQVVQQNVA